MRTACPTCEPYHQGNEPLRWRMCRFHVDQLDRTVARIATNERLSTLASNLSIGAALCRADHNGEIRGYARGANDREFGNYRRNVAGHWTPGCGKESP